MKEANAREMEKRSGSKQSRKDHRLDRGTSPTLRHWHEPEGPVATKLKSNVTLEMGWGRLIFAHTFSNSSKLASALTEEREGQRDIAFYVPDPHVILSQAPQELFLDPSHTYRLWLHQYRPDSRRPKGFLVRRIQTMADVKAMNRITSERHMVPADAEFVWKNRHSRARTYFVAEDVQNSQIIGAITGVDHKVVFDDPEGGSSFWALVVDPQAKQPGIGEVLVRHMAEHYLARGRVFLDLSVMHDNKSAIALYKKLGFQRVPVYCIKRKNPINEPLFIAPQPEARLNPYATIIIDEARRRGIHCEVLDEEEAYFRLSLGGRSVLCRESLTEFTNAITFSLCDNKKATRAILSQHGLQVPAQQEAGDRAANERFLQQHERLVVKPMRGEQGAGISVDVRTKVELKAAIAGAEQVCDRVLLEEFVEGEDLRIIVINKEVVAAAVRKPASVVGTGQHTVAELIEKQSRRRAAATDGESHIPLDAETERCVQGQGFEMDSVLPKGKTLPVRKTANLHTGGTIHDVTAQLHQKLADAAVQASLALNIPVVGLDFLVPKVDGEHYKIIEANERPGLANHEPQPTAERFIDFLFPQTISRTSETRKEKT